jgi:hypothetical protein
VAGALFTDSQRDITNGSEGQRVGGTPIGFVWRRLGYAAALAVALAAPVASPAAAANGDPVIATAGDIACKPGSTVTNNA